MYFIVLACKVVSKLGDLDYSITTSLKSGFAGIQIPFPQFLQITPSDFLVFGVSSSIS